MKWCNLWYLNHYWCLGYTTSLTYELTNVGYVTSDQRYNCFGDERSLTDCAHSSYSYCLTSTGSRRYGFPIVHCKGEPGEMNSIAPNNMSLKKTLWYFSNSKVFCVILHIYIVLKFNNFWNNENYTGVRYRRELLIVPPPKLCSYKSSIFSPYFPGKNTGLTFFIIIFLHPRLV